MKRVEEPCHCNRRIRLADLSDHEIYHPTAPIYVTASRMILVARYCNIKSAGFELLKQKSLGLLDVRYNFYHICLTYKFMSHDDLIP